MASASPLLLILKQGRLIFRLSPLVDVPGCWELPNKQQTVYIDISNAAVSQFDEDLSRPPTRYVDVSNAPIQTFRQDNVMLWKRIMGYALYNSVIVTGKKDKDDQDDTEGDLRTEEYCVNGQDFLEHIASSLGEFGTIKNEEVAPVRQALADALNLKVTELKEHYGQVDELEKEEWGFSRIWMLMKYLGAQRDIAMENAEELGGIQNLLRTLICETSCTISEARP